MDEENTVKSRLKAFVAYLNMSEREFCRTIGVGSAYIASIKKSIKADKLEAISRQSPLSTLIIKVLRNKYPKKYPKSTFSGFFLPFS